MKYNKYIIMTALALLITGCNDEKKTTPKNVKMESSEKSKTHNAVRQEEHLSFEITDNMKIEADVSEYQEDAYTYTAVKKEFSKDTLRKYFFKGKSKVKMTKNLNGLNLEADDGSSLFVMKGSFSYSAGNTSDDIKYLIQGAYASELNYRNKNDEELQNLSEQQTVKSTLSDVKNLYVPGKNEKIELLAGVKLNADRLLKQQKLEQDKSILQSKIESGRYHMLDASMIPDDCYYMILGISKNGIPLLGAQEPGMSIADENSMLQNTYIEVLADRQGILNINVTGAYSLKSNGYVSVMTPTEACKTVQKKYDKQILTSKFVISNVWLEYVFIADPKAEDMMRNGEMRPYWCFEIVKEDDKGDSSAERINAANGENLTYGK